MYIVRFSPTRLVPYTDPLEFDHCIRRWLTHREAENVYLFDLLSELPREMPSQRSRLFTVVEDEHIAAAGVCHPGGALCMTWATPDWATVLADHIVQNQWHVAAICAPGHTACHLSAAIVRHTRQSFEVSRSERIYQIASMSYPLPPGGRLERATPAERPLLEQWMRAFIQEARLENRATPSELLDSLLHAGQLYLWKAPGPVAMAAWVSSTPNGAAINFVFTPEPLRCRGYGKAVSAALAQRMLAGGLKHCFILADSSDPRTNHIYPAIGARTVAEFLRCTIHPGAVPAPQDRKLVAHSATAL